jgi:multidrug efflux pump subunit AcrA (membrane-fusion protein)
VREGAVVLRLARLDGLYIDVDVPERDVHEIRLGARGEIAFASRPDETFPLTVRRIDPVAQSREHGAVFPVECEIAAPVETWWRPGMTGVAKIEAGRRTFFWVLTHRLVDWLHLKLWW